MNGVNAVIQTWGLGRASNPLYHISVYWFSPLLGLWIGMKTIEALKQFPTFLNTQAKTPVELEHNAPLKSKWNKSAKSESKSLASYAIILKYRALFTL